MSAICVARDWRQVLQNTPGNGRRSLVIIARWMIVAGTLGWHSPGWGQTLTDPTRPSAAWLASQAKGGTASAADAGTDTAPQLQSLLLSGPRKYAIIDGHLVGVGDTYKDALVIAVRPTEVVLRTEQGTQTLKLFPDVEKRAAKSASTDAERRLKLSPTPDRKIVIKESK